MRHALTIMLAGALALCGCVTNPPPQVSQRAASADNFSNVRAFLTPKSSPPPMPQIGESEDALLVTGPVTVTPAASLFTVDIVNVLSNVSTNHHTMIQMAYAPSGPWMDTGVSCLPTYDTNSVRTIVPFFFPFYTGTHFYRVRNL